MKIAKRLISLLLTLCLTAGLFAGMTLTASATDWTDYAIRQQLVVNQALSFFYKGGAVQYDSYYIGRGSRYKSAIIRTTNNRLPEDATYEEPIYTVCSAYPHDVYFAAFGQHIITDSMVAASAKIKNANIRVEDYPLGEYDPALDYPTSILNVTSNYTYYGGIAARELKKQGIDITSRDSIYGGYPTHEAYPEVLCYFGPPLDENGKAAFDLLLKSGRTPKLYATTKVTTDEGTQYYFTEKTGVTPESSYPVQYKGSSTYLSGYDNSGLTGEQKKYYVVDNLGSTDTGWESCTFVCADDYETSSKNTIYDLTFEDIQYLFDHVLQPGDVVTSMMGDGDSDPDGGHAMMYIGDIDGDGVGELIHSWGAKYNGGVGPHSSDDFGRWGIDRAAYTNSTYTDRCYGINNYYYGTTIADKSGTLPGYDIREAPTGWYAQTGSGAIAAYGDGKNYKGGNGSMMTGPEGGGSIVIEDWNTRMGKYISFSSTTKVKSDGSYNYNTSSANGTYYMAGGDPQNTKSPYELTILRPLNSPRFANVTSGEAKGRYNLGDLTVTKLCTPGYRQAITAGDTITYEVRLHNPKANSVDLGKDLGFKLANSYTVDVVEPIPAGTEFVSASVTTNKDRSSLDPLDTTYSVQDGAVNFPSKKIYDNNETVTCTYTVRIQDTAKLGDSIVSADGKVWLHGSTASYLKTKNYTHPVGGVKLTDAQRATLLGISSLPGGETMDVVRDVYGKLGMTVALPSADGIFRTVTTPDIQPTETKSSSINNYYYKYRFRQGDQLTADGETMLKMVVPNYLGGEKLMTYDANGVKTNMNRLRDYSESFIQPGDVLLYADVNGTSDLVTNSKVYVYLGKSGTDHSYYASYENGQFVKTDAPLKDIQYKTTNYRNLYSDVLTQAFRYDLFLLLRPTQAVEDLNTTPLELSGVGANVALTWHGETKGFNSLSAAITDAKTHTDATAEDRVQIKVNCDLTEAGSIMVSVPLELDLGGHTVAMTGEKGYINFGEVNGVTVRNGTITSEIVALYCGSKAQNIRLEDMTLLGGEPARCEATSLTNEFLGSAIGRSGSSTITLKNVLLGSRNSEVAPIQTLLSNAHNNTLTFEDNVTVLVPKTGVATTKTGTFEKKGGGTGTFNLAPWSTAKASIVMGTGVQEYVRPGYVKRTVNGGPVQEYAVYIYTTEPAAQIGSTGYGSLTDAILSAKKGNTVTLLRNVDLPDRRELGVTDTAATATDNAEAEKYLFRVSTNLALDLAGYRITDADTREGSPVRITAAETTLENGTISAARQFALSVGAASNVTMQNMTLENTGTQSALYQSGGSGAITGRIALNSCFVTATASPILLYGGDNAENTGAATVQNGTVVYSENGSPFEARQGTKAVVRDCVLATGNTFKLNAADPAGEVSTEGYEATAKTDYYLPNGKTAANAMVYAEAVKAVKIGETEYATLAEAIAAAVEGDTIEVVAPELTIEESIELPANVTLQVGDAKVTVAEGATLTVSGHVIGAVSGDVAVQGSGTLYDQGAAFEVPQGITGPVRYDKTLVFDTWSLNLDDAIRMNLLSAVTDGYVMMDGEKFEGNGFYPTKAYHAKNMVDYGTATLVREQNSRTYAGIATSTSVRGYAEALLNGVDWSVETGENGARIGRLMLAMLDYGAAAQKQFAYSVDDPANKNVTDLLPHLNEIPAEKLIREDHRSVTGDASLYYGTAAVLGENMHLKFYLKSAEPVTAELRYTDYKGETHTVTRSPESAGTGYWAVTLTDLVAADIDTEVTLKVSVGGVLKATVTDSISGYLERVKKDADENTVTTAKAMLVFGVAAQEYFGKSAPALNEDETPLS